LRHHRAGRLAEAEALYRQIIAADSRNAESIHMLGLIAHQVGRSGFAVEMIRSAIGIKPDYAEAHANLGLAFYQLGRVEDAFAACRSAIALKPGQAEAHSNLGTALKYLGHAQEAIATCRAAVILKPSSGDAWSNLGMSYHAIGRIEDAVRSCRTAIAIQPDNAEAHSNLGVALKDLGRHQDSIAAWRIAIRIKPGFADAYFNLGTTLYDLGRTDAAIHAHRAAIALRPDHARTQSNLGIALISVGRLSDAISSFRHAIAIEPQMAAAQCNLGVVLRDMGRFDEADEAFATAIRLDPDLAEAYSDRLFTLCCRDDTSGDAILAASRRFAARFESASTERIFSNERNPDRVLRIGYVSADFYNHSVSYFLGPTLANHDRSQVEVTCYSNAIRSDAVTRQLRASAANWRSLVGLDDESARRVIEADGIDILVDLSGHSAHNRLLLFARRAAPIQVTWLGYPGTTGLSAIDYRLVDAITDPPGDADRHASEALYRLDGCFVCYAPPMETPEPGPPPSLTGAPVTFGSFNNPAKLSAAAIATWAALLLRQPDARLFLKGKAFADEGSRALTLSKFAAHGIPSERILVHDWTPGGKDHLSLYGTMDVALDPFPYNGTTTTCEALWMGVPVVTLRGQRHSARVGASLLAQVGLDNLVAADPEEYVSVAIGLAADGARRAELRRTLRSVMSRSRLCDGHLFARSLEAAYRDMWRRWCRTC
jgi:protein O-GlcNAc transferase